MLKKLILVFILTITLVSLTGCKDYCSYGGCMREAVSGGRCSLHKSSFSSSSYDRNYSNDEIKDFVNSYNGKW